MRVINAVNVNDAYAQGLGLLLSEGVCEPSRAGDVLVMPEPVTTVYERPRERVLFDPGRDANPFFHLFESLWMLSGDRDARWLDRFVRDFSARFAEDDGLQHGAYGFRWRNHFDIEGGGHPVLPDQLDELVRLLRENPRDRRTVLTMWDPTADLGANKRDVPCNTHAYLRVRQARPSPVEPSPWAEDAELDLTVCCRSNDAVWGAYGANAVHFSMLQEYLAGRLGVRVGKYYQVSNNFHVYSDVLSKVGVSGMLPSPYPATQPIGADWSCWDDDLDRFMEWAEDIEQQPYSFPRNPWFEQTAMPLFATHARWRAGERATALELVSDTGVWPDMAPDWRAAALEWMQRRMTK